MRRAARLIVDHTLGDFVTYLVAMTLLSDDSKAGRARARRVVQALRLRTKVLCAAVVGLPVMALISFGAWGPASPLIKWSILPIALGWLIASTWLLLGNQRRRIAHAVARMRSRSVSSPT